MSKRILYVIGSLNRGGAEVHLTRILPSLKKSGFDVSVFCFTGKGELARDLVDCGIAVSGISFLDWSERNVFGKAFILICSYAIFIYSMLVWRPAIVHFFLPESYVFFAPVSLVFRRVKKVMSRRSRNTYQQKKNFVFRWFEKALHPRMDAVIGNSKRVQEDLLLEGCVPSRLHVIYNGITPWEFSQLDREEFRNFMNIPDGHIVVTCVANLIPYKGHRDLIDAFSRLEGLDNWCLLLVGDGGERKSLEAEVSSKALSGRILFLGARRDVKKILNASDIGVLVSHEEGFSNAVIESMNAGLPMVVSDVGGNSEAVIHGECGEVVPAHSPNELAAVLENLILDGATRKIYGDCGKLRVATHFSHNECIRKYIKIYQIVCRA